MTSKFSIKERLRSFKYAFNGIKILLEEEPNLGIHYLVAMCVIIAGFVFKISLSEWTLLIMMIGVVIAFEIMNSSIENIADWVSKERNIKIKRLKDLSAAAVLVSAMTAFIIGLIIFLPKILVLC